MDTPNKETTFFYNRRHCNKYFMVPMVNIPNSPFLKVSNAQTKLWHSPQNTNWISMMTNGGLPEEFNIRLSAFSHKICLGDDSPNGEASFVPHRRDCDKFYHCSNGVAYLKTCPAGLHFNNILKVCDWPESAGCENDIHDNGNDDGNEEKK